MRFYSSYLATHHYQYLPDFAHFIRHSHIDSFVIEQLKLSREVELPLLKQLSHIPDEQLLQMSKASMHEYLQYLTDNQGLEQIKTSLEKWKNDQLEVVGMYDIVAEDITLINFIRGKALRKFIPLYVLNIEESITLADEIDSFLMGSTTASINTYIEILKEEIQRHEKQLLEAQAISKMGSFDWNVNSGRSVNSPQIFEIFEMDSHLGIEKFLDNVHPDDQKNVKDALSAAFVGGDYESEYKYVINNKIKFLWSRGKVLKDAEGKPLRLIGTVQDISERKIIENELFEKNVKLEKLNANLEQFAYAASHDLKEPIRKINIFLTLVRSSLETKMNDQEKDYFNKLEKSSERMKLLVDNLLEYSQASQLVEFEDIDLNVKIRNVLEDLEVVIKEEKAEISFDKLPVIKGHKRQFQQLFQNLIGNAIKYHKPGITPKINISCSKLNAGQMDVDLPIKESINEFYIIQVQDNGIGFEQEDAEKIFNVFTRLHSNHEYKGTGIGLSIARKVVENHGGYLIAESKPNEGSTFKVYLPAYN